VNLPRTQLLDVAGVGEAVVSGLGVSMGDKVGDVVGALVGAIVGGIGVSMGGKVGDMVGAFVGAMLVTLGVGCTGIGVGAIVGLGGGTTPEHQVPEHLLQRTSDAAQ